MQQKEKEKNMERHNCKIRTTEHRMKQFDVMGCVRPQQLLDGIFYDMEAFHRVYGVWESRESFLLLFF